MIDVSEEKMGNGSRAQAPAFHQRGGDDQLLYTSTSSGTETNLKKRRTWEAHARALKLACMPAHRGELLNMPHVCDGHVMP